MYWMAFSHSEATDKLCINNKRSDYSQVQFPNIEKKCMSFYCGNFQNLFWGRWRKGRRYAEKQMLYDWSAQLCTNKMNLMPLS